MELSFDELVEGLKGKVIFEGTNKTFNEICTDTRKIAKDNVFLALKGENFNGNEFALKALDMGASIVIVDEVLFEDKEVKDLNKGTVIKVSNTYQSLLSLAKYYREKLRIKVVGITGSTGKTSTKDLTSAFLSGKYKVFKTEGNFNNHIGLPLMILKLSSEYDVAVLELGMSNLKEIHTLAECARPDIAVITNIGLSHIENLKTQDNILKAKMEITDFFNEKNTLIVNAQDEYLQDLKCQKYEILKTGYDDKFNFVAKSIKILENKTVFDISDDGIDYTFDLPMVGAHNVLNALLAVAVSKKLGLTFKEMIEGLKNIKATSMRLQFIKKDNITIINDCYNASPDSMKAALDVLNSTKGKRKVAILGTMNELGHEAENSHEKVAEYAKGRVNLLIVTGDYSESYKKGFEKNDIRIYNTKVELIEDLKNVVKDGDVILVKASRGIKYEDIVKHLENL